MDLIKLYKIQNYRKRLQDDDDEPYDEDIKYLEKHLDPEKQGKIEAVVSKSKLKMQHWTIYWVL